MSTVYGQFGSSLKFPVSTLRTLDINKWNVNCTLYYGHKFAIHVNTRVTSLHCERYLELNCHLFICTSLNLMLRSVTLKFLTVTIYWMIMFQRKSYLIFKLIFQSSLQKEQNVSRVLNSVESRLWRCLNVEMRMLLFGSLTTFLTGFKWLICSETLACQNSRITTSIWL